MNDEIKAAASRRSEYLAWLSTDGGDDTAFDWYEGAVAELDKQILCAFAIERLAAEEVERVEREKPIDDEWVKSIAPHYWAAGSEYCWPKVGIVYATNRGVGRTLQGGVYLDRGKGCSPMYLDHIATRGQLLELLRAFGIEAKGGA